MAVSEANGPLTASEPLTAVEPFTVAQAAEAKAELGTNVDLVDLHVRYTRLEDLGLAITEVLRERLATLKASPAIFGVEGYNQNATANIAALEQQLAGRTGTVSGLHVVRIVPPPPMRRR